MSNGVIDKVWRILFYAEELGPESERQLRQVRPLGFLEGCFSLLRRIPHSNGI